MLIFLVPIMLTMDQVPLEVTTNISSPIRICIYTQVLKEIKEIDQVVDQAHGLQDHMYPSV